eukprot:TRINITY_DN1865_c0_g1_i1.p1 TRINITY_DN1865_c0_g1~~TRINITY_DN1865_c0_g1_i1.p1  ORF type:complete len:166 (+),score=26.29 TRINITY_DN1865_c0_g1_i1:95-592(+)
MVKLFFVDFGSLQLQATENNGEPPSPEASENDADRRQTLDIDAIQLISNPPQHFTFRGFLGTIIHFADDDVVKIKIAVMRSVEELRNLNIAETSIMATFQRDISKAVGISDERVSVMSWICEACTFVNDTTLYQCEICQSPNKVKDKSYNPKNVRILGQCASVSF